MQIFLKISHFYEKQATDWLNEGTMNGTVKWINEQTNKLKGQIN